MGRAGNGERGLTGGAGNPGVKVHMFDAVRKRAACVELTPAMGLQLMEGAPQGRGTHARLPRSTASLTGVGAGAPHPLVDPGLLVAWPLSAWDVPVDDVHVLRSGTRTQVVSCTRVACVDLGWPVRGQPQAHVTGCSVDGVHVLQGASQVGAWPDSKVARHLSVARLLSATSVAWCRSWVCKQ